MGTRGTLGFVVDGQVKMTYNHFDSYPDGLGEDVLAYLRSADLEADKKLARRLVLIDDNQIPTVVERQQFAHLWDTGVSTGDDWYAVLRHAQGNPRAILDAGVIGDASNFPADSLFCEYGYVINFDDRVLEFYRGFVHAPHSDGRFAEMPARSGYYPIRLVSTHSFDEIPPVVPNEWDEDDD